MALQAASVVFLFLSCLLFPNGAAQTLFESWTVAFDINASDPREVQRRADEVKALVSDLTAQITSLSANLTNSNTTDYALLISLLCDVENLANNITDITAQYNSTVELKNNATFTLGQINDTLHCFADSGCVTGVPFTGSTIRNPCSSVPCQNGATCNPIGGGYTCTCGASFTGSNCETFFCDPDPSIPLSANKTWQDFSSSQFPRPIHGFNCTWRIRAPPGQHVLISVLNVNFNGTGGVFQVIDWNNSTKPVVFNATENIGTNNTLEVDGTIAAIYFSTVSQAVAGAFEIQYLAVDFNACTGYSCGNGTCFTVEAVPQCKCNSCWTGANCNITEKNPCDGFGLLCGTHGSCIFNQTTCRNPSCNCTTGYTGDFCSEAATTASAFRYYKLYDKLDTEE